MIKHITNEQFEAAIRAGRDTANEIPKRFTRKRWEARENAILRYISELDAQEAEIHSGDNVRIVYKTKDNLGTRKWSDYYDTVYETGVVTITRQTDKTIWYRVAGYSAEMTQRKSSTLAIIPA